MNRSLLFIEEIENESQKRLMQMCYDLIRSLIPHATSIFKWGCPFFDYYGTYFCYINIHKNQIYLAFVNCQELEIPTMFSYERKKVVLKIFIDSAEILQDDAFIQLIMEAALLHEVKNKK